jgi:hypothetical protein
MEWTCAATVLVSILAVSFTALAILCGYRGGTQNRL